MKSEIQVPSSPACLDRVQATPVYDGYWRFAAERQNVFYRRLAGQPAPWTDDPIISAYKFTNAYRASDRVSQYLIRHVIYRDDLPASVPEIFFRILLFKLFNKIETWELLERQFGPITFSSYDFRRYDSVLTRAMQDQTRVYSAAYIMPSGRSAFGHAAKHRNHLLLLERMMADNLAGKLERAATMEQAFLLLRAYPSIGNFLAYQFATDVNYSEITDFSEMEFVVPGPGAIDGIRKCFGDSAGYNDADLIRLMADRQESEFERLGLSFKTLRGRRLQLIDCQNLFCETGKYARIAYPSFAGISGRTRIKQSFSASLRTPEAVWYPPKWGINHAKDLCLHINNTYVS